ncbi:MAG: DUF6893 family small protein [Acidimicrobiales bacterium]
MAVIGLIAVILVGLAVVGLLILAAVSLPDIARYRRVRRM